MFLLSLSALPAFGQTSMVIKGNIRDSNTKEPLPYATIGVKGKVQEAISISDGSFEFLVPASFIEDTLRVTYLGYKPFYKKIKELASIEIIYLEETRTLLDEVAVSRKKFNTRHLDKDLRLIRDQLYAMETEVTNEQYNLFLSDIEDTDPKLLERFEYDLSSYDKNEREFFVRYSSQSRAGKKFKDSARVVHIAPHEIADYPAINVPFDGAIAYCAWLTDQYNSHPGRKKFRKIKFRLATIQEWQIAALGYRKFQTWILKDNLVEVTISEDTASMMPKGGQVKRIPVGNDILYPWFRAYRYRQSPRNHLGCFLGNFKVTDVIDPCPSNIPSFDGWSMMGRTASFFPNDMGLYDVVGNVAEMIDEKGKACGGSWNDPPQESTIHSIKTYTKPNSTIGFRVFMEVEE